MTSKTSPIALVTGGSRGLGENMTRALAARGVGVVLTYRSQEARAHAIVAEIEKAGGKAAALALDTGDTSSFDRFTASFREALTRRFQRDTFDFLVNNAGVAGHSPVSSTAESEFDALMNVHLKGPFFLTQKLLPLLVDGGRILNVSTGLARFTLPGYGAYAAMKGGIEVWTRYLAKELGPRGISVNVLAPGAIETDFGGGAVRDNAEINQLLAGMTALGRVGVPDDIGPMIASLLSADHRWVNAQRIEVSGGQAI